MSNKGKNITMFIALVIVMFLVLSASPLFIVGILLIGLIYRGMISPKIIKPIIIVGILVLGYNFVSNGNLPETKKENPISSSPEIELNEMQTYTYNDTLTKDKIIADYVAKVSDDKDTLTSADVEISNYEDLLVDFNNPDYTGTENVEFTVTDTDGNTTKKKAKLKITAVDEASSETSSSDSGIISGTISKVTDKAIANGLKSQIDNKGHGTSTLDPTNGLITVTLSEVDAATGLSAFNEYPSYQQKIDAIVSETCGKSSSYHTISILGNDGGAIYSKNC